MTDRHRELVAVIRAAWSEARGHRPDLRAELDHALAATADLVAGQPLAENDHPAARSHLAAAIAHAESGPLAAVTRALAPIGTLLPWHYGYPDPDPRLAANVAFAELVGPRAPFFSDRLRLGFTLMGPELFYPPHAHPAIELYHLVTGRSEWTAGEETTRRAPGAFILHPSEIAHAMRSGAEPLLALYAWRGAIFEPPRYL